MIGLTDVDVVIVGAGLAGIGAACRLRQGKAPPTMVVLESRDALGGTWDLFRYPGVRSDSDMATLSYAFRPWRGDAALASGEAIRAYIAETASVYGIDRAVRYRHRVIGAAWSSDLARWALTIETPDGSHTMTCGFLYSCTGYYDYAQGHAPRWPAMDAFTGPLVHPQFWPPGLDVQGKRVVVIGSGATAVTLVPALVRQGASVTMLQRSPSYVVALSSRDRRAAGLRRALPAVIADKLIRWKNIAFGALAFRYAMRRPQAMRLRIRQGVRHALGPDYDIDRHFRPTYPPWDQRLCVAADGDLFTAIRQGHAAVVTGDISRFTSTGIRLDSGQLLPADIVVSATGLSLQLCGGIAVHVDGKPVELADRLVYRGAMIEDVPNFAFAFGYANASWTLKCDLTARFVARLLRHMARRRWTKAMPHAGGQDLPREPLADFSSGYVTRAAHLLPKRGPRPWRAEADYIADVLVAKRRRLDDGVLCFSRNTPALPS